ncbi:MAG: hypothetical protein FWH57_12285 [Oscillospiraceae bacterium]|nr:hypothetical protein [Oscillospiraceae bacterium]
MNPIESALCDSVSVQANPRMRSVKPVVTIRRGVKPAPYSVVKGSLSLAALRTYEVVKTELSSTTQELADNSALA